VGFDVTDYLSIRFSACMRYCRRKWNTMREYMSCAYDSVKMEVLYGILIEYGVPITLVQLIKMRLNETYNTCLYHHRFSTLF
jgi:hypothetical protein